MQFTICKSCGRLACYKKGGCRQPACFASCEPVAIANALVDICVECILKEVQALQAAHNMKVS